jgi:2-dehydropantoate 2-reductase
VTKHAVVVGAGAVGAVYGRHIKRAGTHLTYLVRPKYADEVRRGIRLYHGRYDETLVPDDVVTDVAQLKGRSIQQVWLCVPTTGVDDDFLAQLRDATEPDTLIVDLTPDLSGRVPRVIGADRVVNGIIPFIAYQTPLPNVASEAHRAPGVAYWLPPLIPTTLSGKEAMRAANVIRRGGMRATIVDDAAKQQTLGAAMFAAVIATLEASDWKLAKCRANIDDSAREAVAIAAHMTSSSPGLVGLVARPFVVRTLLALAPAIIPLPLEPYLEYHFTKVAPQMRASLKALLDAADNAPDTARPEAPHLRALAASLPALHAAE